MHWLARSSASMMTLLQDDPKRRSLASVAGRLQSDAVPTQNPQGLLLFEFVDSPAGNLIEFQQLIKAHLNVSGWTATARVAFEGAVGRTAFSAACPRNRSSRALVSAVPPRHLDNQCYREDQLYIM